VFPKHWVTIPKCWVANPKD